VYRLYKLEGLEVRTKKRRKMAGEARVPAPEPAGPHERWAMDFVSDGLADGTPFRVLTVVDHFSRLNLALEVRKSFRGEGVARVLASPRLLTRWISCRRQWQKTTVSRVQHPRIAEIQCQLMGRTAPQVGDDFFTRSLLVFQLSD
jgi:transposase InsO family protein